MLTVDPSQTPIPLLHQYIIGSVAPRPIAFVSTISEEGVLNLAPYSFFNAFGANPPTLIFSANRRVRGNTTKDTLQNVEATREVVINMVNYDIAYQMALASVGYPSEVDEFEKAGLTPVPSDLVKPFRVKESPIQMECKVVQIMPMGEEGGAPNLVICEILRMHIDEAILDENGKVDPQKADLMGRMGRAFYCRAHGANVFPIVRSVTEMSIGMDQLPEVIRHSKVLSGNDLAQLAGVTQIPEGDGSMMQDARMQDVMDVSGGEREKAVHGYAKELIGAGEIEKAWQVLLAGK